MRLDLHMHTVMSDGEWTPERVVEAALDGGLDVISIADHDTTAGVPAALAAAEGRRLDVIPATELSSTTQDGRELHILGYFVELAAPSLEKHEKRALTLRLDRIRGIVDRLARRGVHVEMKRVLEVAGPRCTTLGRPHLARAMVEEGIVGSVSEAFDRFIGDSHEAFLPTELASPGEAIAVILEAGGVPVWAHPPHDLVEELLPGLVESGLRGIEIYRPRARSGKVAWLERLAADAGLLRSGGSDWHGPDRNPPLGDFHVTADEVSGLLAAGGF